MNPVTSPVSQPALFSRTQDLAQQPLTYTNEFTEALLSPHAAMSTDYMKQISSTLKWESDGVSSATLEDNSQIFFDTNRSDSIIVRVNYHQAGVPEMQKELTPSHPLYETLTPLLSTVKEPGESQISLPASLRHQDAEMNKLASLPYLPASLRGLEDANMDLTRLVKLPTDLLRSEENKLLTLPDTAAEPRSKAQSSRPSPFSEFYLDGYRMSQSSLRYISPEVRSELQTKSMASQLSSASLSGADFAKALVDGVATSSKRTQDNKFKGEQLQTLLHEASSSEIPHPL